mgnify:CR=1 FL=1
MKENCRLWTMDARQNRDMIGMIGIRSATSYGIMNASTELNKDQKRIFKLV